MKDAIVKGFFELALSSPYFDMLSTKGPACPPKLAKSVDVDKRRLKSGIHLNLLKAE